MNRFTLILGGHLTVKHQIRQEQASGHFRCSTVGDPQETITKQRPSCCNSAMAVISSLKSNKQHGQTVTKKEKREQGEEPNSF